jgi:hypothetical protein
MVPRAHRKRVEEYESLPEGKDDPLSTSQMQELLRTLRQWRRQSRLAQGSNRIQMAIDEDFYDCIQLDERDLKIMEDRAQPPLTFNVIKNTINWILGTERKSRIDYRVLPRKKKGAGSAKAKTKTLKFINDVSRGEYARSEAFADAAIAGIGWLESGARKNGDEPVFLRSERWRNMWYDHLGTEASGADMRWVLREKWADLDIAQKLFPQYAERLEMLAEAVNSLYPYVPDDVSIMDEATEFDMESEFDSLFGGEFNGGRKRIKLVECWYRVPESVKLLHARGEDTPYGALDGAIYRDKNPAHEYLVRGKYFSLTDATIMVVRQAIWAGATFLQEGLSPYNHNRFPFTPIFCYRRRRDNMPYGVIRDLRDPQSDLNKRKSRALFLLSSNRVIAEKGAVDNKIEAYEEVNRPDGWIEVNKDKKFEIVEEKRDIQYHVEMARDDERFIQSISGVTDENLGKMTNATSGKAIEARQLQGYTTSGVVFDNYYFAFQCVGEIMVSLTEQFHDDERELRITGDRQKDEFIKINERDKDGKIKNNITESKADFIVAKQDFRESVRMAMFEMLSELVQGLSQTMPEVALALLDMVVEYMDDLPNKDEIVARIRKINNQHGPDEELTPEDKVKQQQVEAAMAQKAQMQEQMAQALQQAELVIAQARAAGEQTKAIQNIVSAQMQKLDGYLKAINAAQAVAMAPQLTGAADQLIKEAEISTVGAGPGKGSTGQVPMDRR